MKLKHLTLFIAIIIANAAFSQKVCQTVNRNTNEPIPYVNIQVVGKQLGYTSNLEGQFKILTKPTDSLIFSAIGFEKKTISTTSIDQIVYLDPISYDLPEITITNEEEKIVTIGWVRKQIFSWSFGTMSGAYMIARFFPYKTTYKVSKKLNSITFLTESDVEHAIFNIRLHKADSTGKPGLPIYNQNLLVKPKKGYHKTTLALEKKHIEYPREGLFVVIEWLDLEENKYEYSYKDSETKKEVKTFTLEPSFAAESHEKKENGWINLGEWKKSKYGFQKPIQMKIVLTN